jgi:uncharacterized protein YidB (DUF937 family)
MTRGFPSMTALLGILAVAGYQNRDKIAEMLRSVTDTTQAAAPPHGIGGLLSKLGNTLSGAGASDLLSGGLGELVDRFKQSGQHDAVNSWVGKGPNQPLTPSQLEQAIGPDVLDKLSEQIGIPRDDLVAKLTRELPNAVDKYTPEGRLPAEARST